MAGAKVGVRRRMARDSSWHIAPAVDPVALDFPPGFRFGAGTSAHQVEGGLTANTWARWEQSVDELGRPRISGGQRCGRASDHWRRFDEDVGLMRWLGIDTYRFSVEWSRVEPRPGELDVGVLLRYRQWCETLLEAAIEPLVTLHHFTDPVWFADRGGFAAPDGVLAFVRFVRRVVEHLGDRVAWWVTINEPVAYAVQGWWRGVFPPGRTDPAAAVGVLEQLLLAHADAYRAVHELASRTPSVGLAHNVVDFRARWSANPADQFAARLLDRAYNRAVPDALATGQLRVRLPGIRRIVTHECLRGTQDFLGLNHYHPLDVAVRPLRQPPIEVTFRPGGVHNDLGWPQDPRSLTRCSAAMSGYGLPIVVLEHGTADAADPDALRESYLAASLAELSAAVAGGLDVRGYVHWSLLDNFEWTHGFTGRFGLFRLDRETGERTPTRAAGYYRRAIAASRVGSA
jgi:Beta-glucosidase/6-phospho-beta-glucosidase/beta-galactosidase